MNASPAAIASIQAQVTDWTQSDAAIVAALNAPSVANPVPQPTIPTPFTIGEIFGMASAPSLVKLAAVPFLPDVRNLILANDRSGCAIYTNLFLVSGTILQSEHDAIMGVLAATQPDPSWAAQISWAEANLGRQVDAFDIAASRPGA